MTSTESWFPLSTELPYLRWREWDRCKKLKIAVRSWFLKHVKTIEPLIAVSKSNEDLKIFQSVETEEEDPQDFLNSDLH